MVILVLLAISLIVALSLYGSLMNMCDNFRDHILYISQQKKRLSLLEICYAKNCKATRTTVKPASSVTMKLNTQTKAPQWVSLQGMICI